MDQGGARLAVEWNTESGQCGILAGPVADYKSLVTEAETLRVALHNLVEAQDVTQRHGLDKYEFAMREAKRALATK